MDYSGKLKYIRKSLNVSQYALAIKTGINRSTINRIENGIVRPDAKQKRIIDEIYQSCIFDENCGVKIKSSLDIKEDVSHIVETSLCNAFRLVNATLLRRNFLIGKRIDEEIITTRSEDYGKQIMQNLSEFLTEKYGSGFNPSSLYSYLLFYRLFPNILDSLSTKSFLSWTHYRLLIRISDDEARSYYEKEAFESSWSVRQLQRMIHSQYYERLLSTQVKGVIPKPILEKEEPNPLDYIKNPIIAESLGFADTTKIKETDLEQAIIDHIRDFLLEMGKGYAFVARQKRMTTANNDYFVDLVLFNIYLNCYVLIDLKSGRITHQDVGQMDMYVRMFDERYLKEGRRPTLGIVLCSETDEDIARYSLLNGNDQIFASEYKTYIPDEAVLRREIENQKAIFELTREINELDLKKALERK